MKNIVVLGVFVPTIRKGEKMPTAKPTRKMLYERNENLKSINTDLLEACKYVVKYHLEHDSGEGELFGLDFVTTCISAIAKAEGAK